MNLFIYAWGCLSELISFLRHKVGRGPGAFLLTSLSPDLQPEVHHWLQLLSVAVQGDCTISRPQQQCLRVSVASHPHQHLGLSISWILAIFKTLYFEVIVDFHLIVRENTEKYGYPLPISLNVMWFEHLVELHFTYETDIGAICWPCSDFSSFTSTQYTWWESR